MKTKVVFEYTETGWAINVQGAESELEALQAFNSVLLTCSHAIPKVECNKAKLIETPNEYIISVGVLP